MLGQAVREYRIRLGLSQEELARSAGVDVKTIGNIEAGRTRPRLSTVGLLADALRLDGVQRSRLRAMAGPESAGSHAVDAAPVPAQLPADVSAFVGRQEQLDGLDALLTSRGEASATAVQVSAVSGTAGVGKPNPGL